MFFKKVIPRSTRNERLFVIKDLERIEIKTIFIMRTIVAYVNTVISINNFAFIVLSFLGIKKKQLNIAMTT